MRTLGYLLITLCFSTFVLGQPNALKRNITIEKVADINDYGARVAYDDLNNRLFYSTAVGGIYELQGHDGDSPNAVEIATTADHGILTQLGGMTIYNGTMYIVGSLDNGDLVTGYVKKANLSGPLNWITVLSTEAYQKSNSAFDHRMNSVRVGPNGDFLYINSGSRTDHGEEHLGFREVPLTAKIFKVPIEIEGLILTNDEEAVADYVFARGTRNSFGLSFNAEGHLFGTENSGDRDHPEELNWIRENHHYGFPWTMGGVDNPQQFDTYDPGIPNAVGDANWCTIGPSTDLFIQTTPIDDCGTKSYAWVQNYFYNDTQFPSQPEGVTFTEPVINTGPFADIYRDEADFLIKDASTTNYQQATFSSHLSPTGIVFDTDGQMPQALQKNAFMTNFNSDGLVTIFNEDGSGGSLMALDLTYDPATDNYTTTTEILVQGFESPTDVEINGNILYIIDYSESGTGAVYAIFVEDTDPDYLCNEADMEPTIDGVGDDPVWDQLSWIEIDNLWVDEISGNENTIPTPDDFSGRFKLAYKDNSIFVLAEITDDVFESVPYDPMVSPAQIFDHDVLEIFIDEDFSGGAHTKTHNAFAYHLSANGNVADQCGCGNPGDYDGVSGDWDGHLFNENVEYVINSSGNIHTWEVALKVYNENYEEDALNNDQYLVELNKGKTMGLGIAYNDYDNSNLRHLMGSFYVPGDNNGIYGTEGGRNVAWQDASVFGTLILLEDEPALLLSDNHIDLEQDFQGAIPVTIGKIFENQWFSYSLDQSNTGFIQTTIDPITGELNFSPVNGAYGEGVLSIMADNGKMTIPLSLSIFVNDAPFIEMQNQSIEEMVELTFQPSVSDSNIPEQILNYSLDESSAVKGIAINQATGEVSWTPDESQDGEHEVTINVSDGIQSVAAIIIISVSEVNLPPVLEQLRNQIVNEGEQLTYSFAASDPDLPAQTLTYSLDQSSIDKGIAINGLTGEVNWRPNESQGGEHEVVIDASDGTQSDTETIIFSVIEVNSPPAFDQIMDQNVFVDEELLFFATASDPDIPSQVLTYSLDQPSIDKGVSINPVTGGVSWIPDALQIGEHEVEITADDGALTDVETVSITVGGILLKIEERRAFVIYPNPARNEITIHGLSNDHELEFFSLDGKTAFRKKPENKFIDTSSLHSGLYIVIIRSPSGDIRGSLKLVID